MLAASMPSQETSIARRGPWGRTHFAGTRRTFPGPPSPPPDGPAPLADGEAELLLHGNRLDQLDAERDVVPGHDHLGPRGERADAGHVGRPEVELGPGAVEEGGVPAPLLPLEEG